jgi:hypothetical protein
MKRLLCCTAFEFLAFVFQELWSTHRYSSQLTDCCRCSKPGWTARHDPGAQSSQPVTDFSGLDAALDMPQNNEMDVAPHTMSQLLDGPTHAQLVTHCWTSTQVPALQGWQASGWSHPQHAQHSSAHHIPACPTQPSKGIGHPPTHPPPPCRPLQPQPGCMQHPLQVARAPPPRWRRPGLGAGRAVPSGRPHPMKQPLRGPDPPGSPPSPAARLATAQPVRRYCPVSTVSYLS